MSETITIVGRLGTDPELRFGNNGDAICSFRVVTDRRYKDAAGEWQSADTTWWGCTAWRQLGENVAESLTKGDMVILRGTVKSREWETKEGEKRTVFEVDVKAIGPDLGRATAKVSKVERSSDGSGREVFDRTRTALADDPWATPSKSDEIPF